MTQPNLKTHDEDGNCRECGWPNGKALYYIDEEKLPQTFACTTCGHTVTVEEITLTDEGPHKVKRTHHE